MPVAGSDVTPRLSSCISARDISSGLSVDKPKTPEDDNDVEGDVENTEDDEDLNNLNGSEEDSEEDSEENSEDSDADTSDDDLSDDSEDDEDSDTDDSDEDSEEKEELDANKKAELKDKYRRTFKITLIKCKFDKSFNDLTLEEKVKFFTALSKAWTKNEPNEFMTDKEIEQLNSVVVKEEND